MSIHEFPNKSKNNGPRFRYNKKFAYLPTQLTSNEFVWFSFYYEEQEYVLDVAIWQATGVYKDWYTVRLLKTIPSTNVTPLKK